MNNRLSIYTAKGTCFFMPEEVMRLEASSNYTIIYLTDHRKYMTPKVLKCYTPYLESLGFVRVHRAHLINPLFIAFINREGIIHMKDDTTIKISRRKKGIINRDMTKYHLDIQIAI